MSRSTHGLFFVGLLAVASSTGCGAFDKGHIDPRVASQITVSKIDPPVGCEYRGTVKGTAPLGDLNEANTDVLRHAVLKGGNYVAVDLVERPVIAWMGSYEVTGRAFACPANVHGAAPQVAVSGVAPGGLAPAMQPSPVAVARPAVQPDLPRACDPECAAGYSCQLGACVAAAGAQAARP